MAEQTIVQRAIQLAKAGRKQEARELLEVALRKDPHDVAAWSAMARASETDEEALEALNRVLELKPGDPWATRHIQRLSSRFSAAPADEGWQQPGAPPPSSSPDPPAVGWSTPSEQPPEVPPVVPGEAPMPTASTQAGPPPPPPPQRNRTPILVGAGCAALVGCAMVGAALVIGTSALTGGRLASMLPFGPAEEVIATEEPVVDVVPTPETGPDGLPTVNTGLMSIGSIIEGRIDEPATADSYIFEAPGPTEVSVAVSATEATTDPRVRLYGPDGTLIGEDDDSGGGRDALLQASLPAAGTYTIRVTVFSTSTGGYSVLLQEAVTATEEVIPTEEVTPTEGEEEAVEPEIIGPIAFGETIEGSITDDAEHIYFFDATEGQVLLINAQGVAGADTRIDLFDSGGALLASDDDGGEGFNARLTFTVPIDGRYGVKVSIFVGTEGSYRLSIVEETPE